MLKKGKWLWFCQSKKVINQLKRINLKKSLPIGKNGGKLCFNGCGLALSGGLTNLDLSCKIFGGNCNNVACKGYNMPVTLIWKNFYVAGWRNGISSGS